MTGIEGNFRQTCNNVMRVLRENKDSVMAVLEAFVYDPLLNWRLIDGQYTCSHVTRPWCIVTSVWSQDCIFCNHNKTELKLTTCNQIIMKEVQCDILIRCHFEIALRTFE